MNIRRFQELQELVRNVPYQELEVFTQCCDWEASCEICGKKENLMFYNGESWNCIVCISCLDDLPGMNFYTVPQGYLRMRFAVLERDGFQCVYCGRTPQNDSALLEVDHVIPRSRGGTDSMDNLVTSCHECNAGKGDILLIKHKGKM